jgi:1-acyl-sn-glycerol-3-phosphate acyltransferase
MIEPTISDTHNPTTRRSSVTESFDSQKGFVPKNKRPHLRLVPPPRALPTLLNKRDPGLARKLFPFLSTLTDRYYRAEVEGIENLSDRGSMVVSTHNGSINTPDFYCLLVAFWRRFGLETPGYGMMHNAAFKVPVLGHILERLGALPASGKNARIVLENDLPLLVCPGGDLDALKPYTRRHEITFGPRRGFIRLAIAQNVPIIPVVSVGAHETLFILNDGRRTARFLGVDRALRIKSVPLSLSFPLGLTIAGLLSIPLPSKITIRILKPIHLDVPAAAAGNDAVVEQCFERVQNTMQEAVDALAAKRRWPILG